MPVKILIIKPSSLGDIVHTLPAVAAIRDAQPDAEITWVINSEWATLLRGNPDVDHLHIFPRSEFQPLLTNMITSTRPNGQIYWHVKIIEREGQYNAYDDGRGHRHAHSLVHL